MTDSSTSLIYRTLPKVLLIFGLMSIVYLGYTLNLAQKQFSQPALILSTEPAPTAYPTFYDPKKLKRKVAKDRYLHQFNYNGTIWPKPHDHNTSDEWIPLSKIELSVGSQSKQCDIFEDALNRYDRILTSMIENSASKADNAVKFPVKIHVQSCEREPSPSMNEEYKVIIHKHHGEINSNRLGFWP